MSDEEKNLTEDCIKVRVDVVLPAKMVGDEYPKGMIVSSKQLIDDWMWRSTKYPDDLVAFSLEQMTREIAQAIKKEVERGTER